MSIIVDAPEDEVSQLYQSNFLPPSNHTIRPASQIMNSSHHKHFNKVARDGLSQIRSPPTRHGRAILALPLPSLFNSRPRIRHVLVFVVVKLHVVQAVLNLEHIVS